MADSRAPAYLTNIAATIVEDADLELVFVALIANLGEYPKGMVRRAFQTNAIPTAPDVNVKWCALQIVGNPPTNSKSERQQIADPARVGSDPDLGAQALTTYEQLTIRVTTYGPSAQGDMSRIRDGLRVGQNRDVLRAAGLAWQDFSGPVPLHEISGDTNQRTQRKFQADLLFQRQVTRVFAVRNIIAADFTTHDGVNPDVSTKTPIPPMEP